MSDPAPALPFRATRDGRVFATCPWCEWNLHRCPVVVLPLNRVVLEVQCERRQCRKHYLLLIETSADGTMEIVSKRRLMGQDARHYHTAVASFPQLNEDEIALWCEVRERAIQMLQRIPAA